MMLKEVKRFWHKQFGRALPVEALARTGVELPGNGIKLGLSVSRKVGPLGKILAKQSVGVLVDPALPGAVRIGEEHLDREAVCELFVFRHLFASIIGQRFS